MILGKYTKKIGKDKAQRDRRTEKKIASKRQSNRDKKRRPKKNNYCTMFLLL
jgi:hypothetical protein